LLPDGTIQGRNDFNRIGYGGPCPPPGDGPHRYFFRLYALDTEIQLQAGAGRQEFARAIDGHILTEGNLMGTYQRKRGETRGA
jgi:Raf kinase inhibitor-like YbhB/YbcL family protein